MWAFSFLRVIYTVSLSSQLPSECCVCLCCRVWLNFFRFPSSYCVYPCRSIPHGPPPWQTNAQKLQPGKVSPRKTHFLYTINTSICTCIHARTKLFRDWIKHIPGTFQDVHPYMYMNLNLCNWPALKASNQRDAEDSAVRRPPRQGSGHWGLQSHLGQARVPLETCHAEYSKTFFKWCEIKKQISTTTFFFFFFLPKTVLRAWDGSEILLPRPCICAFSAWCSPKFRI